MISQADNKRKPFVALILALGGFVSQTQLTHHVLTVMEYNRPFFVFYVTQSVFSISLFCHLTYLTLSTKASVSGLCKGLRISIVHQLRSGPPSQRIPFPLVRFILIALILTIGFTVPTLLWFVGISLSPA
ncbi:hypothetical protein BT96DRAFT_22101 [Gymnopus androsaceus JB14]|uniref:Uncharacterized protein n=1 Tax=Gymnopus androsaceus JB14 TaxID=1447944 RepID=A0A6A4IFS6_9AGAR|nr:hypothetical protein BT96DRAFT_22101 [Gymnopus androsaceus JB14]